MRWFFRSDFRSFRLLNATQFLGALNDNIFKLLVIYLLIHVKGAGAANSVLSLAGAIFVIPFLLFSSGAGVLADRLSKRNIIVFAKFLELFVMLFGVSATLFRWEYGAYSALFLMAMQSAIFGPSKYGIILELVEPKMVSKANGSMTSLTYLAIILGTFLASFITDITHKNFVLEAVVCVGIALLGVFTSLGIKKTKPQNSTKKINPVFFYEIYQTLKVCWNIPYLLPSIYCSSFFLFVGAFAQLNIIPFAMQSLGLSEVGGGYLFLPTAVGIAIGSVLSSTLCKGKIELGISCIAGFLLGILSISLWLFSWSLIGTIINLTFLGICGGIYLIPFDSFLQVSSPDHKRGQIIAAANFFSFVGVLMAAFCLYFLSENLGLTAAQGFAVIGGLTFVSNLITTGRLSPLCFPFLVEKFLKKFRKVQLISELPQPNTVIVLQSRSWLDALALISAIPKLRILFPGSFWHRFPLLNGWIESIRTVPRQPTHRLTLDSLLGKPERVQNQGRIACLFLRKQASSEEILKSYQKVFGRFRYQLIFAHGKKEKVQKKWWFFRYHQRHITVSFKEKEGQP